MSGSPLLNRDRVVVLGGLFLLAVLAWTSTLTMAGRMAAPADGLAMPHGHAWGAPDLVMLGAMWVVMMAAMMTPSAAPVVLLVAAVNRTRRSRQAPLVPTAIFLLGYAVAWIGYASAAAGVQVLLHNAALLSPRMATTSPLFGGALLITAGLYQLTPLKETCLAHCRSPLGFLSSEWREGARGALVMGLRHGSYCVGCCWLLMALLFVAGVMNLLWVTLLAGLVLVEKVAPGGRWVGRLVGLLLVAWGGWMAAMAFV